jgi:hypothetical protein
VGLQFLKRTALAGLIDNHGWFQVETPPGSRAVLRSVVYVDGDVTTKLFGGPPIDPLTVAAHFDAIARQASAASMRIRRTVQLAYGSVFVIALGMAAWVHDPVGSAVFAAALLLPVIVDLVRSASGKLLVVTPQISAVGSAIGVLVFAIWSDSGALRWAACVTIAFNLGLALALWIVRWRLQRLFLGLKSAAIEQGS